MGNAEKSNNLKVLAIPLQRGLCREVKSFVHNKALQIDFSKQSKIHQIPKNVLEQYPAIALVSKISDEVVICLQYTSKPKKRKKEQGLSIDL